MRSSRLSRPLILATALCLCTSVGCLVSQTGGRTQGNPGRAPTNGPEQGMFGGKGATTRPGSHESSGKDEADRVAGKFPPPKERSGGDEERRAAAAASMTAYVDAVALEGERQAVTLSRDDFGVTVDGAARRVISIHYVFRGPQAQAAGRSIPVGSGVIADADESRTIIVVVDQSAFPAAEDKAVAAAVTHVLDVVGSVDRAAVLALPQPGPLQFAATRADLAASVARITGRAGAVPGPSFVSFDALGQLLKDLTNMEGPKNIVIVEAEQGATTRPVTEKADGQSARLSAILDAAAASRTVVHVVTIGPPRGGGVQNDELHAFARSTGGTVTRLAGAPRGVAPLAAALLGGYLLEIDARGLDRGSAHALAVTSSVHGVRVLAATRWVPRYDALPAPVVKANP